MNQANNQTKHITKIQKGKHQRDRSESRKTMPWNKKSSEEPGKKIQTATDRIADVMEDALKKNKRDKFAAQTLRILREADAKEKAMQELDPIDKEVVPVKKPKKRKAASEPTQEQILRDKHRWTMQELLKTKLPEPRWAIPDLLPIGLTFISGLPKAGKSWLALQLAVSLSLGEEIFGTKVEKRKVLYLALEDGARRLQDRLIAKGITTPGRVTFYLEWPLLEDGGVEKLAAIIQKYGYDFIIIDTLSRACGKDQLKANEMVQVLGPLQKLAIQNNLAVVVIDHNSKSREGEPVLKLYGSIAKGGVADTIYDLTSNRTTRKGLLRGVGRDIGSMTDEVQIHLEWDDDGKYWKRVEAPLSPAEQLLRPGSFKEKVVQSIRRILTRGELATCNSIAIDLAVKPPTVSVALAELCELRIVIKLPKQGREQPYICPTES